MKELHTIQLQEVPAAKGLKIEINSQTDWAVTILDDLLGKDGYTPSSVEGSLHITRIDDMVNCSGKLKLTQTPSCARCGEELERPQSFSFQTHLAPLDEKQKRKQRQYKEDEEIELVKDDLDFSYYENDTIPIGQTLNDEIAMNLPYNFYCDDKDACQKRYDVLIEKVQGNQIDPRWAALQNLKVNKKTENNS